MLKGARASGAVMIMLGLLGLLLLDWHFWKMGTAPDWWLRLRAGLTVVVLVCLAVPIAQ